MTLTSSATSDSSPSQTGAPATPGTLDYFYQLVEAPSRLDGEEQALVEKLEQDLAVQLKDRPRRLAHSLSVGHTAEALAALYGVDPLKARVAGILHDWEKAFKDEELVGEAQKAGIDFGVDLSLVKPLIHGVLAARRLPERYGWLDEETLDAIACHTTGSKDPSPLSQVLFVADGIEPLRGSVGPLDQQRQMVAKASLFELYLTSFCDGIIYVIQTRRYLYPGTIDIYNALIQAPKE